MALIKIKLDSHSLNIYLETLNLVKIYGDTSIINLHGIGVYHETNIHWDPSYDYHKL